MTTLTVDDIDTHYGNSRVFHGVSLEIDEGEVVTPLGHNGAGKATTRCIMGVSLSRTGSIGYRGEAIAGIFSDTIHKLGTPLVPEDLLEPDLHVGLEPHLSVGRADA